MRSFCTTVYNEIDITQKKSLMAYAEARPGHSLRGTEENQIETPSM